MGGGDIYEASGVTGARPRRPPLPRCRAEVFGVRPASARASRSLPGEGEGTPGPGGLWAVVRWWRVLEQMGDGSQVCPGGRGMWLGLPRVVLLK